MNTYKILGIGAPVLDCILHVESTFLDRLEGEKEGMVAIDEDTFHNLIKHFDSYHYTLGGSACNTLKGLAQFNHSCAFWGKIGNDPSGHIFKTNIEHLGIKTILNVSPTSKTAHALCFVTDDGKRTMRTHLGASLEMNGNELSPEIFKGIKLLHLEGYSLLKKNNLALKAFEMAKAENALISMDLSSFEIVNQFKSSIESLLSNFVDIVFANEQEAFALFGLNSFENCLKMNRLAKIAVILCGKEGCLIGQNDKVISVNTRAIIPKDTTGAGDFFASGFLHGYLEGYSIEKCAQIGNRTASVVIQIDGTDIPKTDWDAILRSI